MTYSVEFFKNSERIGKITLNVPGGFVLEPVDSNLLRKVLAEPIWVANRSKGGTEEIYSYNDPVKFIKSLSLHYRSQGLRASNTKKSTEGKTDDIDIPFADRPPPRPPPPPPRDPAENDRPPNPETEPNTPSPTNLGPAIPVTDTASTASGTPPIQGDDTPRSTLPRNPPPPAPHTGGGPIDQRRYGEQPGLGWRRIGTSARGTPIWDWGPPPPRTPQEEPNVPIQARRPEEPTGTRQPAAPVEPTAARTTQPGPQPAGPRPERRTAVHAAPGWIEEPSAPVEAVPGAPNNTGTNQDGQNPRQPVGDQTPRIGRWGQIRPTDPNAEDSEPVWDEETSAKLEKLDRTLFQFQKWSKFFMRRGIDTVASWLHELQEQINDIGLDQAIAAFPDAPTEPPNTEVVAFKGTRKFVKGDEDDEEDLEFLRWYLGLNGILFQHDSIPFAGVRTIRSAPVKEEYDPKVDDAPDFAQEGDYVPAWTNFKDKLQETKYLPGLESAEDVDIIMGALQEVPEDGSEPITSQFTPEVISKLDEKFGKDQWIVKTYGDEAYAGWGIFLPPRVHHITSNAKAGIAKAERQLKEKGYILARDRETKRVIGIATADRKNVYRFDSDELHGIQDKEIEGLSHVLQRNAPNEHGALMASSAEQELNKKYGASITWGDTVDEDGRREPVSLFIRGKTINFGTPEFEAFEEHNNINVSDSIQRAVDSGGLRGNIRYFASPAAPALGVTDEDRAQGITWEKSQEGRVHLTTKDGKVSKVPFASLANRRDPFPVIFPDKHILAMEDTAEKSIEAGPEEERMGQNYATDTMRTPDGWLVVERNSAVPTGTSSWMENNAFVIDAYVSHIQGREPMHARFLRKILKGKKGWQQQAQQPSAEQPSTESPPQPIAAQPVTQAAQPRKAPNTALMPPIE